MQYYLKSNAHMIGSIYLGDSTTLRFYKKKLKLYGIWTPQLNI